MKILSIIEATTVTGPAKTLLIFSRQMSSPQFSANRTRPVEMSIVTFQRQDGSDLARNSSANKFVSDAREMGISVDVINERFRFDTRVIDELRVVVGRRAPDIIQTHHGKSHFLVKLSGLWKQYPWIAFHHGYTATDLKMRLYNQLDRLSLRSAARVATVCEAFADQLVGLGVQRDRLFIQHNSIEVNANGAPGQSEESLRRRFGVAKEDRLLLAVGRLSREKGQADLVTALGHVKRQARVRFKLLLVGDGLERERIERAANAAGIGDRVIFAGHVTNVRPFYEVADLLVLPSHSEGSPNVLLEAMAAGVPVVATSVGGVPEIVNDLETALLVPPREPLAMSAAIERALTDTALATRLAKNASAVVAERHSPEAYAKSLLDLYQDVVKKQARG